MLRRTVVTGVAVMALAVPASAMAEHIVTVNPGTDCSAQISTVTQAYNITPTATYTSSTCGFTAKLTKKQIDALQSDPSVLAITSDSKVVLG
jgi:hypothetical protein